MVAMNAAPTSVTRTGDADRVAAALGLDFVNIALRSLLRKRAMAKKRTCLGPRRSIRLTF
jgi:hypothetical protein